MPYLESCIAVFFILIFNSSFLEFQFLDRVMELSKIRQLNRTVYIEKKYCSITETAVLDGDSDDFCYLEKASILFSGIGANTIVLDSVSGFEYILPTTRLVVNSDKNDKRKNPAREIKEI